MKLVILDSYALHEGDLNWDMAKSLVSEVKTYTRTSYQQAYERLKDADFAICNKCPFDEELFSRLPKLKWIGETATGTDNIDLEAAKRHNVTVANVPGYSTHSVAQLTFAFILQICQCPARHEAALRDGYWQLDVPQRYNILPQTELFSKTLGLIGCGDIALQVANIAKAFGMKILCHTRTEKTIEGISFVSLEKLLEQSDIISLHCPLTPQTREIINETALSKVKKGAILINTARGALVNDNAVCAALEKGTLLAYGTDVFAKEPLVMENPLLKQKNAFLTPHIAWATTEALSRLSLEVCLNLKAFLDGIVRNAV